MYIMMFGRSFLDPFFGVHFEIEFGASAAEAPRATARPGAAPAAPEPGRMSLQPAFDAARLAVEADARGDAATAAAQYARAAELLERAAADGSAGDEVRSLCPSLSLPPSLSLARACAGLIARS